MGEQYVDELLTAFRDKNWTRLQELAASGADINAIDASGLTALMHAATEGEAVLVQGIVESGADLDVRSKTPISPEDAMPPALGQTPPAHADWQEEGKTALFLAAEHGHLSVVETLIDSGADADLDDRRGDTPLMAAAKAGHGSVVVHFVASAPAEIRTAMADDLLKAVLEGGHAEAAELAIEAGASEKVIHGSGTLTPLYAASLRGQAELVKVLLKAGADAMTAGVQGIPLIAALRQGHDDTVRALAGHHRVRGHSLQEVAASLPLHISIKDAPSAASLRRLVPLGFDIEAVDAVLRTPLQQAAEGGHVEMIEILVEAGAAVDGFGRTRVGAETSAPKDAGRTPLMLAAAAGHTEAVQKLLDLGADAHLRIDNQSLLPEPTDPLAKREPRPMQRLQDEGCNALMLAAQAGHLETVQSLLAAEPDLETENHEGATAILLANNHDRGDVVAALEAAGASTTPLGPSRLLAAVKQGDAEALRSLLGAGVPADAALDGPRGGMHTALHLAAAAGHPEIAEILLEAGADVNATIAGGASPLDRTALHLAAAAGHDTVVRTLLSRGADSEARVRTWDGPGDTAVGMAAERGHAPVIAALAEGGASLTGDDDHTRPLTAAAVAGHGATVRELIARGAPVGDGDQEALVEAASGGHLTAVHALLEAGADCNVFPADGWSALTAAVANNHEDVAERLLEAGADANGGSQLDQGGASPLDQAIMGGRLTLVQALLEGGADVRRRGSGGKTPLMDAVTSHPTTGDDVSPLLEPLLTKGAELDVQNDKGETALHLAIEQGKVGDATFLIEAGADLTLADQTGRTALSRAIERGFIDLATLLQSKGAAAGNVQGPLQGDFTPREEDSVDNRELPIEERRGLDLEDNDDTLILVKAPLEASSQAFQQHCHAGSWERDVLGKAVPVSERCFLSFRLTGQDWTVIRSLHLESSSQQLKAEDAKAVSQLVDAPAILFLNSDNASVVGYTYFEEGEEKERFFYDPESGEWDADHDWEEDDWDEDDESWDVEEEEGWEGPPPTFLSRRRQLDTRHIEDPWAFVDNFLREMEAFAPSLSFKTTKAGKEYTLTFEGFEDEDFERLDFIAAR